MTCTTKYSSVAARLLLHGILCTGSAGVCCWPALKRFSDIEQNVNVLWNVEQIIKDDEQPNSQFAKPGGTPSLGGCQAYGTLSLEVASPRGNADSGTLIVGIGNWSASLDLVKAGRVS